MYLDLNQVKKHLNLDDDFTEDDGYLTDLINVSEAVVEKHIDNKLNEIAEANGGELPPPLLHACLLLIANLYENRESIAYTSVTEIPLSYEYLLSLYKNYKGK